jgi:hypothetical protein
VVLQELLGLDYETLIEHKASGAVL